MNSDQFEKLVGSRLGYCHRTLQLKAKEYATSDRLHNFKVAAVLQDIEPETALFGMWAKHIVSIRDIVENIEHSNTIPSESLLNEKITDMINYAILLEALIEERKEAEKDE